MTGGVEGVEREGNRGRFFFFLFFGFFFKSYIRC